MALLTQGTVTAVAGSNIITGKGTRWASAKNGVQHTSVIMIKDADGKASPFVVKTVNSDTEVSVYGEIKESFTDAEYIATAFDGTSMAYLSGQVASMLEYHQRTSMALFNWFDIKKGVTLELPSGKIVDLPDLTALDINQDEFDRIMALFINEFNSIKTELNEFAHDTTEEVNETVATLNQIISKSIDDMKTLFKDLSDKIDVKAKDFEKQIEKTLGDAKQEILDTINKLGTLVKTVNGIAPDENGNITINNAPSTYGTVGEENVPLITDCFDMETIAKLTDGKYKGFNGKTANLPDEQDNIVYAMELKFCGDETVGSFYILKATNVVNRKEFTLTSVQPKKWYSKSIELPKSAFGKSNGGAASDQPPVMVDCKDAGSIADGRYFGKKGTTLNLPTDNENFGLLHQYTSTFSDYVITAIGSESGKAYVYVSYAGKWVHDALELPKTTYGGSLAGDGGSGVVMADCFDVVTIRDLADGKYIGDPNTTKNLPIDGRRYSLFLQPATAHEYTLTATDTQNGAMYVTSPTIFNSWRQVGGGDSAKLPASTFGTNGADQVPMIKDCFDANEIAKLTDGKYKGVPSLTKNLPEGEYGTSDTTLLLQFAGNEGTFAYTLLATVGMGGGIFYTTSDGGGWTRLDASLPQFGWGSTESSQVRRVNNLTFEGLDVLKLPAGQYRSDDSATGAPNDTDTIFTLTVELAGDELRNYKLQGGMSNKMYVMGALSSEWVEIGGTTKQGDIDFSDKSMAFPPFQYVTISPNALSTRHECIYIMKDSNDKFIYGEAQSWENWVSAANNLGIRGLSFSVFANEPADVYYLTIKVDPKTVTGTYVLDHEYIDQNGKVYAKGSGPVISILVQAPSREAQLQQLVTDYTVQQIKDKQMMRDAVELTEIEKLILDTSEKADNFNPE